MGKIRTVIAIEDNSYVKELVNTKVDGDVMVIEGKGSTKYALLGDNLAKIASENGWSGFVINGCIRDSEIISSPNKNQHNFVFGYNNTLKDGSSNFIFGTKIDTSGVSYSTGFGYNVDISENIRFESGR